MKKTVRLGAVGLGVAALVLTGCGDRGSTSSSSGRSGSSSSPSASNTTAAQQYPDKKACMVSDSGGFNDKSFNQTSYEGFKKAVAEYGLKSATVESNDGDNYNENVDALVKQNCDIIVTVGFNLGDATLAAAKANPDIDFAIVDYAYFNDKGKNIAPKNLKGLTFNTEQPAYLAGYLAAGTTQSGVVGTFGGQNIPTVTSFMTGFQQGVEKYNADNNDDVKVIGWDSKTQKGSFTNDFNSKSKGQDTAEGEITQGADIIMPVAGPAGLGGLQALKDKNLKGIWVDTDGCRSASEYCPILLTSVMKGMDVAVEQAITSSLQGKFDNTPYAGTLENGGVGIAPYHDQQSAVSSDLDSKIQDLKQQIIDGSIKVG